MTLRAEILSSVEDAEALAPDWDRLAVEAGSLYSSPGWGLAWWRHSAPPGAALRIVVVRAAGRVVAVAPLWVADPSARRGAYAILGNALASPCGVLVAADAPPATPACLAAAIAGAGPRPASLEVEDVPGDPWLGRLAAEWPGWGARIVTVEERPLPTVGVDGRDFDEWLAGKRSNFRNQARRFRRRLEDEGVRFEQVDRDGLDGALDDFIRLHGDRWKHRGGSNLSSAGPKPLFGDLARAWPGDARLRVYRCATDTEPVAVLIAIAGGGVVEAWNSGFDRRWEKNSPSIQLALFAVADACERGERTIRLGGGDAAYKLRLADELDSLTRRLLVPRDPGNLLAWLRLAPVGGRAFARRHLSEGQKDRLRRLARR